MKRTLVLTLIMALVGVAAVLLSAAQAQDPTDCNGATPSNGGITVDGTAGNDIPLSGTPGNDVIRGLGGNDLLEGGGGDDCLDGGDGIDKVKGGDGGDLIFGGNGDDHGPLTATVQAGHNLGGGPGNDRIFGGPGDDFLAGGDGEDYLDGDTGSGDNCRGGNGTDTLILSIAPSDDGCEAAISRQ